jgi:GAF domain-containing protein
MTPYHEPSCRGNGCHGHRVLGRSEDSDLSQLAAFAGRILHAPVAYIAISQPDGHPTCRFGAGTDHWESLEALPAVQNLVSPIVLQDVVEDLDDLGFAAIAPIQTLCRKPLGMLVVADRAAHDAFTAQDLENLAELAAIIGDRIAMRMIASQAVMTRSLIAHSQNGSLCASRGSEAIPPNLLEPAPVCGCPDHEALQWA